MQFPVDLLCGIPVAEPSRQTVSEKFSDDVARETNDGSDENDEEEANDFADDARMVLERPPDQLVAPVMKRVAFFQKCSCVLQVRAQEIYKLKESQFAVL